MAEKTNIEWCDATINFWWGCTKVSPGCANCYAETLSHRFGDDIWGKGNARPMHPNWVRSLRDQCEQAEVPFFFKQWGSKQWTEHDPENGTWRWPNYDYHEGYAKGGRELDDVKHDAFPKQ